MSNVIDSKVVEMRFDNSKFESNVKESLSTLDKLKLALNNLTGKKAAIDIDASSSNKGMSALSSSVQNITSQFSALQTIATGALLRIGSQAIDAGEKMLKSLTVDQISAGYDKYDQKTSSIQTLVNSTGKSVEEINKYLEKLMWYSDETSYGFTDMTSALATMTSSGGDINKLIPMIEGVANATAFAGKGAAEFSRIMQFGINQAYSLGYMQVQDWKTIEGATVNSKQLQEALIGAGEALGTIKKGEVTLSSFRNSLKDAWLTTEVMEEGFGKFAELTDAAYEAVQAGTFETASEAIEALAGSYDDVAARAFKSAQEAKTFKEAIDATKDAVSSGWMQSFELIIGDYNQAKELWTELANGMWDFFAGGAEDRNKMLGDVLGSNWDKLTEKIQGAGVSTEDFEKSLEFVAKRAGLHTDVIKNHYGSMTEWVKQDSERGGKYIKEALQYMAFGQNEIGKSTEGATKKLEDFQKVINEVIVNGKYGNGAERMKALSEAGYEYSEVQGVINKLWEKGGGSFKDLNLTSEDLVDVIGELSDAELKSVGYTEDQIQALRDLAIEASVTGKPLNQLIEDLYKPSGRELVIDSLRNSLATLVDIVEIVKGSMKNIFPPKTAQDWYNMIDAIHGVTESIRNFFEAEDNVDKLTRAFNGLFAVVDIIGTLFGGAFKIGLEIVKGVLQEFGISALDAAANIGDMLVELRNWIDEHNIINKIVEKAVPLIVDLIKGFQDLTKEGGLLNTIYKEIKETMQNAYNSFSEWVEGLQNAENIPEYIVSTLAAGLEEGSSLVFKAGQDLGLLILGAITQALGLDSETDEGMYGEGKTALSKFLEGFKNGIQPILDRISEFGKQVENEFKKIDWSKIAAVSLSLMMVVFVAKLAKGIGSITKVLNPISSILTDIDGLINTLKTSLKKLTKAMALDINAGAMIKISVAIAILAGSLKLLSTMNWQELLTAGVALTALMAELLIATAIMAKIAKSMSAFDGSAGSMVALIGFISSLGVVVLLMSGAAKIFSGFTPEEFDQSIKGLTVIVASIGLLMFEVVKLTSKYEKTGADKIKALGLLMLEIGATFLIMANAVKIVSKLDEDQFNRGMGFITISGVMIGLVVAVVSQIKNSYALESFGKMMTDLGIAFALAAVAMRIVGTMDLDAYTRGISFLTGITGLVMLLMVTTKLISTNIKEMESFGKMMERISASFLIAAIAMKIIGSMDLGEIVKAGIVVAGFTGIVVLLAELSSKIEKELKDFGTTMVLLSASLTLLAVAMKLLGTLELAEVVRGGVAITALCGVVLLLAKGMSAIEKDIPKISGALIGVAGCIALLSVSAMLMGLMDGESLAKGVTAVSVLLIAVGIMLKIAGAMSSQGDMLKAFIGLATVIAVIAASVAVMSLLDLQAVQTAAFVMECLLGVVGILIAVMGLCREFKAGDVGVIAVMAAVIVAIAGSITLLAKITDGETALKSAQAIALVMAAMGAVLAILNFINPSWSSIAKLAVIEAFVLGIAGIFILINKCGVEGTETVKYAIAISTVLIGMSIALGIATIVGAFAPAATAGIVLLGAFIVEMTALMVAIGGIFKGHTNLIENLDIAIAVLEKVGEAIGSIVGGFAAGATSSFAEIGDNLGAFAKNAEPFFDLPNKYGVSGFEVIEEMLDTLKKVVKHDVWSSIVGKFTGDDPYDKLKKQLEGIADVLSTFGTKLSTISKSTLEKIEIAAEGAKYLTDVVNNLPTSGAIKSKIFGEPQTVDQFCEGITKLVDAIVQCSSHAGNIKPDNIGKVADASQYFVDIVNNLPTTGGLKAKIFGDKQSLTSFSEGIVELGKSLNLFSYNTGGVDPSRVEKVAQCSQPLADLVNKLPKTNDILNTLFGGGKQTLQEFGQSLVDYGASLVLFNNAISGGIDVDNIANVTAATEELVKIAAKLGENDLGIFHSKESTLKGFGDNLVGFGENLVSFNDSIIGISTEQFGSVLTEVDKLATLCTKLTGIDYQQVYSFKSAIDELAQTDFNGLVTNFAASEVGNMATVIKGLIDVMAGGINSNAYLVIEAMKKLMTNVLTTTLNYKPQFKNAATALMNQVASGIRMSKETVLYEIRSILSSMLTTINNKKTDFHTAAFNIMKSFSEGVHLIKDTTDLYMKQIVESMLRIIESYDSDANTKGYELMTNLADGISSCNDVVSAAVDQVMSSAVSVLGNYNGDFYDAGANYVQGIANGINDNGGLVASAAQSLGEKALAELKKSLKEKSPSRATYEMGKFFDYGFANAIVDYIKVSKSAAEDLANGTIKTLEDSKSSIYGIFDFDTLDLSIDLNPVITPTLDLSYVKAEASNLDKLFGDSKLMVGGIVSRNASSDEAPINGNTINFTQNNYSPKALNRIDIYRQTRNQISQLRGATL